MARGFTRYVTVEVNQDVEACIDSNVIIDFLKQCNSQELQKILKDANVKQITDTPISISIVSMEDVLKMELISEAFNKYSIFELEEKLK